jgi:hypothetical protein
LPLFSKRADIGAIVPYGAERSGAVSRRDGFVDLAMEIFVHQPVTFEPAASSSCSIVCL